MSDPTTADRLPPVHPGEVPSEDLILLGLSARALAERIGVPPNRVSNIAAGKRGITGDTALRFAEAFGTTPEFWMNLQKNWELAVARSELADHS
jgi:addiction module HigA family antidote